MFISAISPLLRAIRSRIESSPIEDAENSIIKFGFIEYWKTKPN